jgi:hypothetical protein
MANCLKTTCSRRNNSSFGSPAVFIDPVCVNTARSSIDRKPLIQRPCDSIYGNMFNSAGIKVVFLHCYPSAILLAIIAVIVNSIYSKSFFVSGGHIFVEFGERVFPFSTNGYSTSAIAFIASMVFICATLNHSGPNNIKRRTVFPMRSQCRRTKFSGKTSATFYMSAHKRVSGYKSYASAVAQAFIHKLFTFISPCLGNNFVSGKYFSNRYNVFSHFNLLKVNKCNNTINTKWSQA